MRKKKVGKFHEMICLTESEFLVITQGAQFMGSKLMNISFQMILYFTHAATSQSFQIVNSFTMCRASPDISRTGINFFKGL